MSSGPTNSRVVFFFIMLAMMMPTHLHAQPFPPPAGWEYVRSFDSVNIEGVHARGDTITVTAKDIRPTVNWFAIFRSTNGGTAWDSTPMLHTIYGPSGFFPRSNTLWFWGLDSGKIFMTTTDGGKTYTTFRYDSNDPLQFEPEVKEMIANPFDPLDLVLITDRLISADEYDQVFRSRDGGQSWSPLSFDAGAGVYSVLFDQRQSGRWYVHAVTSGETITYRTSDSGNSFSRIGTNWGAYCGLSAPGVFRDWWDTISAITVIGITDINDDQPSDFARQSDWLGEVDSLPAEYDPSAGLYHMLGNTYYSFAESNPAEALITDLKDHWNVQTDSIIRLSSDVYFTRDDGQQWTLMWGDEQHGAFQMALDEVAQAVWAFTESSLRTLQSFSPHNYTLWTYVLPQVGVKQQSVSSPTDPSSVTISPNPATNNVLVKFTVASSERFCVSVCDQLGRAVINIIDGSKVDGNYSLRWKIPTALPAGNYWLKLKSSGSVVAKPFAILR